MTNDYYRLKATEFVNRLQQIQELIVHNPSRGYVGEELLRDFLRTSLPSSVKVTQGFVIQGNDISPQCDIIICDSLKYAPIYSFGNIDIVYSQSVYAVIEVKTILNRKNFKKVLKDFQILNRMQILHKILFLYSSPTVKTINSYFYPKVLDDSGYMTSDNDARLYDQGDYIELPEIILSLDSDMYMQKDMVQDESREYNGYSIYEIIDKTHKDISCIQKLLRYLTEIVSPSNDCFSKSISDTFEDLKLPYGFPIVEM